MSLLCLTSLLKFVNEFSAAQRECLKVVRVQPSKAKIGPCIVDYSRLTCVLTV